MLLIKNAKIEDFKEVINFFNKYLDKNENVYSEEFLCPFGVKGAISRNQIIITFWENKIIGALRYYPRKRKNITSLYQFAVDEKHRSKGLIKKMLKHTNSEKIESLCLKNMTLNQYYEKTGWKLEKADEKYNYWTLKDEDL